MGEMLTIPLNGYAPDNDPAQPGNFYSVTLMEATRRGWRLARALTSGGLSAALVQNAYVLDGYRSRTTAGTEVLTLAYYDPTAAKVKLLVNESSVLTDESRGSFYSLTDNFSFAQYGDYTLATNLTDALSIRDATTTDSFADSSATGIPKAKIVVVAGPHAAQRAVLLHYNDGTEYSDGVWWSSYGGPTAAWTPDIATGAGYMRLLGCGPITCGIAYGDDLVVFGSRSTWLGRFTGPPELMQFYKLSDEVGCCGPYAAKVVGGVLYWVGSQGLFRFDGTSISRAPFPIQTALNPTVRTQLVRDDKGDRLIVCTGKVTSGSGTGTRLVAWSVNLVNGRVGAVGRSVSGEYFQAMFDGLYYASFHGTQQKIRVYSESANGDDGALGTSGFELTPIGSDREQSHIVNVIPRFTGGEPGSYRAIISYGDTLAEVDDNEATAVDVTASPWRASVRQAARWIRPDLTFTYNGEEFEVLDVLAEMVKAGAR